MAEYKSEVKTIFAPQERVFDKLSDFTNLSVIQQSIENPEIQERLKAQVGDKVSPSQFEQMMEKFRDLRFTQDSVSGNASLLGDITLRIIERQQPGCIKFALEGAPILANMWIQLLPATDTKCAMRLTVKADMNFFIKQMLDNKLKQGVDGLAQLLASIPY